MINSRKLKARIIELGLPKQVVADAIGCSLTSLNYKLNGKTQFNASEIYSLSKLLHIEKQKDDYFFNENVG